MANPSNVPGTEMVPSRRRAARRFFRFVRRNPLVIAAAAFLLLASVSAIFAPWLAPYGFADQSDLGSTGPSPKHVLGTDNLGRDTLSRLMYGGRASLGVSVSVVIMAVLIAVPLGLIAGYFRSAVDYVLMRLVEIGLSMPPLVLALTVAAILGAGTRNTALALTIVFVPSLVRLVRGQALDVSSETFIEASKAIGTPARRIISHRLLRSTMSPLIVQATVILSAALLAEAGLSFLGLGTQLPEPSWGGLLRAAYDTSLFTEASQVVFPGIVIAATVLSVNTVGDALRDVLGLARNTPKGRNQQRGLTSVERTLGSSERERPKAQARAATDDGAATAGSAAVLEIQGLSVAFRSNGELTPVLQNLDLTVRKGEVLGLVGESGAGKSVTALSVMRLLPTPPAVITGGQIWMDGQDLLSLDRAAMRTFRGRRISMIFQDPMTSLDPAFTIGHHLREAQDNHLDRSRKEVNARALELLDLVGISDARNRLTAYPHELSGGMRQRVMIALALACKPALLIADEPTTALDVTVQAQILDLLRSLQRDMNMAMLLVTHDLGVIADACDRVAVMYAGHVVELADADSLFDRPQHPYTEGLLRSMPRLDRDIPRLDVIPGSVPSPQDMPQGCRFHSRCDHAVAACTDVAIPLTTRSDENGQTRCLRAKELRLKGSLALDGTDVDLLSARSSRFDEGRPS